MAKEYLRDSSPNTLGTTADLALKDRACVLGLWRSELILVFSGAPTSRGGQASFDLALWRTPVSSLAQAESPGEAANEIILDCCCKLQ
jgi:hypothetical protein